jgi:hypothetical protein
VNVFLVPKLEVGYGVVADLSDEGVVVRGTLTEKFFRQTVDELVQRFYVKCGVKKGDGGAPWVVAYDSKQGDCFEGDAAQT